MAIDRNSPTWLSLREHIEKEISDAAKALETKGLEASTTEFERGRIKALRKILELGDPPKPKPDYAPQ